MSESAADFQNWTVQFRKGVLELCVLAVLGEEDRYGYGLVRRLEAVPGLDVSEGSIYPLLSRLRRQGLVATRLEESPEGPARKYYRLTTAGRAQLTAMWKYYSDLTAGVHSLAEPAP